MAYAPMHTFKGWINEGLSGSIDVDFDRGRVNHIETGARTDSITTGDCDRNKAMVDFFNFEEHPSTSFRMTECLDFVGSGNSRYRIKVRGVLDFAGIRRQLPLGCSLKRNGESISLDLQFKWSFKAYGLKPPRLLFLKVRDIVDISAHLEFTRTA